VEYEKRDGRRQTVRMKTDNNIVVVGFIVVIFLALCGCAVVIAYEQNKAFKAFVSMLDTEGLEVLQGTVESPSVIIDVYSPRQFMSIVSEHSQDIVYRDGWTFYIFNSGMTVAWRYYPQWRDFK